VRRRAFLAAAGVGALAAGDDFYLPEDPAYTIERSMRDSLRFTVERTLTTYKGKPCSRSSFVDPEGTPMMWHGFGPLEGPGWASNAVGGAYEIYRYGRHFGNAKYQEVALGILDHVLENGFVDEASGFIRGYRHTVKGTFVLNFTHNNDWFAPGAMARIGYQLLLYSDLLPRGARRDRMRRIAARMGAWLDARVKPAASGWYPRRVTPEGEPYRWRAESGKKDDPQFDSSADGLYIVQLMTALSERKLAGYRPVIRRRVAAFINRGGIFGSINQDVYDDHEDVAYAVAFRVLRQVARLLNSREIQQFAYSKCLAGLDQFKMREDRNGVATRGLLFMARSWDTAYLWECAEASLAYLEAYTDRKQPDHLRDALTILRAIAKHHHGPHGFLAEGVDWNNHVGAGHHIGGAKFGDIKYTEPFLNNQHITEPTLYWLENRYSR
jgi:hypothetical protein